MVVYYSNKQHLFNILFQNIFHQHTSEIKYQKRLIQTQLTLTHFDFVHFSNVHRKQRLCLVSVQTVHSHFGKRYSHWKDRTRTTQVCIMLKVEHIRHQMRTFSRHQSLLFRMTGHLSNARVPYIENAIFCHSSESIYHVDVRNHMFDRWLCIFFSVAEDGTGRWALRNVTRGYFLGSSSDKLTCTAKAPGEAEFWHVHLAARPQVFILFFSS